MLTNTMNSEVPLQTRAADDLRDVSDPATPLFLLIDPFLGEPLPMSRSGLDGEQLDAQREAVWQRPVKRVPIHPRTALEPHRHPYLVELQGANDPWVDISLEMAQAERKGAQAAGIAGAGSGAHRIGGWLQSSLYGEQLAQQLAASMRLRCAVLVAASYLRLADPRVFALARHVMGDERIASILGRVQFWATLDAQGCLSVLHSAGEAATQTTLLFSWDEWAHMAHGTHLHPCIAMWLGQAALNRDAQTLRRPAHELFEPAIQSLQAARQAVRRWPQRLSSPKDWSLWAALTLVYPELRHIDTLSTAVANWLEPTREHALDQDPPEALHEQIQVFLRLLPVLSPPSPPVTPSREQRSSFRSLHQIPRP